MRIEFTKMQGAGNDYIYINEFDHDPITNPNELAVKLSDRNFGVGGDGLVLIQPSYVADTRMRMFNADGSESEMCGNAIRCVGKFAFDHGIVLEESIKVETKIGVLELALDIENGKAVGATVNMGVPTLNGLDIPTTIDAPKVINHPLTINDVEYAFTGVSMGNPHAVIFVPNVDEAPVREAGSIIEHHELFPNRVNAEFVEVINEHEVKQRTWERGSGETLACGTGAAAVCVASILTGNAKSPLTIHLRGGDLELRWAGEGEPVFMRGPAEEVFQGIYEF